MPDEFTCFPFLCFICNYIAYPTYNLSSLDIQTSQPRGIFPLSRSGIPEIQTFFEWNYCEICGSRIFYIDETENCHSADLNQNQSDDKIYGKPR